jgi:hypothetical protein
MWPTEDQVSGSWAGGSESKIPVWVRLGARQSHRASRAGGGYLRRAAEPEFLWTELP